MSAGSYSRQWNAVSMSSGIYFYRLQTGSFTETKKTYFAKINQLRPNQVL
jgi:hypothetical protein